MSRSTVDLQAVRFFLGYGLIFIVQSLAHDRDRGGGDARGQPRARRDHPRAHAVRRLGRVRLRHQEPAGHRRRCSSGSRSSPAEVEENVSAASASSRRSPSEERQLARFRVAVKRVFDQSMISTRLSAFYSPLIGFLPNLGLAALLFVGGRQAIHGQITVGEFVAFYRLRGDAHRADADARHRARPRPAGGGVRRARVRDPRSRAAA